MEQTARGNTNTLAPQNKKQSKFRCWAMTIFSEEERDNLKNMNCKYLLMGEEKCPTTGKTHYQTFVQFTSPRTFKALKKKLPTSHIEVTKGSVKQNITYCKKDGNIHYEEGTAPYEKLTAKELREMNYEQIIDYDARCHQAYIKAKNILENDIDIDELKKDIKVYYIQGPSGIGKTEKAKSIIRENKDKYGTKINMIKHENNFYIGVGTARIALYDDFRDSHMKASEFVNMIDYNIHHMNIKGGAQPNKYELLIITSVQPLTEIYKNMAGEPRKQWERRVEIIDMFAVPASHQQVGALPDQGGTPGPLSDDGRDSSAILPKAKILSNQELEYYNWDPELIDDDDF